MQWRFIYYLLGVTLFGSYTAAYAQDRIPIKVLYVTVPTSSQESFTSTLKRFAETHNFSLRTKAIAGDDKGLVIELNRDDVDFVGNNGMQNAEFVIGMFAQQKLPQKKIDEIKDSFASAINQSGSFSVRETQ